MSKLDEIKIKTQDEVRRWGTFSLQELLDRNLGNRLMWWYLRESIGLDETDTVTKEHVQKMINIIDKK
jgi:hypothetical protein